MTRLRAGAATDVGLVRATNQDQLLIATRLFAVADGMGGHAAGEVASQVAVEALGQAFDKIDVVTPQGLQEAARQANRAVWDKAQADPDLRGMGTTLVAMALVDEDGADEDKVAVINVGDSRAYRLHQGRLEQLTVDHSLVQELVAEGRLEEEEAAYHPQRHVLTRALGVDPDVMVDVLGVTPEAGDRFLLCTDGLVREIGDDQVASVLRRLDDPGDAARELVDQAKEHGGNDNITVVVVDVAADSDTTVPVDGFAATTVGHGAGDGDEEGAEKGEEAAAAPRSRRFRSRRGRFASRPRARFVTLRVVVFFVVLLVVLAVAAFGVVWYARDSYFVGLSGSRVTIFQGRPGGVLWFKPTVAQTTPLTTAQVLPYHLSALRAGQEEPSLSAARGYVQRLQSEYSQASGQ